MFVTAWIGLVLATLAGTAAEDPVQESMRVLPPAAAARLEQAFARASGQLILRQASIDRDRVDATVCDVQPPGTCYRLRLGDPQDGCDGRVIGPWCLRFQGDAPPARLVRALRDALVRDRDEDFWITVSPRVPPDPAATLPGSVGHPPAPSGWLVALLALATLVVPALGGWAAGWLVRRLLGRRLRARWSVPACVLLPAGTSLVATFGLVPLGFWDLLLAGLLAGAGFLLAVHRVTAGIGWRKLALGAVSLLVACVVLEAGSRILLPAPPLFAHALQSPLVLRGEHRWGADLDVVLGGLFPGEHPAIFEERTRGREGAGTRVLHVGDSMVRGSGLPLEQSFVAVLDRMEPQVDHINAGIPGVGPDYYLLLIERWLERLEANLVVVYLFEGNDFTELDASYFFCHNGPLLSYHPQGPVARCARPVLDEAAMRPSPFDVPPYSLRVAASRSVFARHVWGQMKRLSRHAPAADSPRRWKHFRAVLWELRDRLAKRDVALVVVFLPSRRNLELHRDRARQDDRTIAKRMRSETKALGITTLDPWELFVDFVQRHGIQRMFLDLYPGDIHFSPEGHRLLASWLHERLDAAAGVALPRGQPEAAP